MARSDFLAHLATLSPDAKSRMGLGSADSPTEWFDITPSDANYLDRIPDQLFVGGAGNVVLEDALGNTITLAVEANDTINLSPVKVRATGTTATALKGLYRPGR